MDNDVIEVRKIYKTLRSSPTHIVQSSEVATACTCQNLFKLSYPYGVIRGNKDYLISNTVHDIMSLCIGGTIIENWQFKIKDAQDVEGGTALVPFVDVARQGVRPAVEPAAPEAENNHRDKDEAVGRSAGQQQKGAGDEEGRNGQERLEAEAVDQGTEEEGRDEHGEIHGQEEVAGRARAEPDPVEERGQDGPQDGHNDAEDEDPGPSRELEPRNAGGAGPIGCAHGRLSLPQDLRFALNGRA